MSTVTGTDPSIPHDREKGSIPKGQYATAFYSSGHSACAVASGEHSVGLPKSRPAPDPWQNYSRGKRGRESKRKEGRASRYARIVCVLTIWT